jgi:hypothetical protein
MKKAKGQNSTTAKTKYRSAQINRSLNRKEKTNANGSISQVEA